MTSQTRLQQSKQVQAEIDRIKAAKENIQAEIIEKGVPVPEGTHIEGLAGLIRAIPGADYNAEYPVGRIVLFYDNEDHSNYLGFTWERCLAGKFPVGVNPSEAEFAAIGQQGGEKTHALTVSEAPPLHERGIAGVNGNNDQIEKYDGASGQPHNNLPPYEVIAPWRRIE